MGRKVDRYRQISDGLIGVDRCASEDADESGRNRVKYLPNFSKWALENLACIWVRVVTDGEVEIEAVAGIDVR